MTRPLVALLVALALACCAPTPLKPRVGAPTGHKYPQAEEQCRAQPTLEWCRDAR